jgi:predicted nucleotidyltransferase
MEVLRRILAEDSRISYALLFGSVARGSAHPASDIDVAIGLASGARLDPLAIGDLVSRLERAADTAIDLVVLDDAPPGIAYRVFRDGQILVMKDARSLAHRKARAILEYLDFLPVEALATRGVLAAAAHGR